MIKKIWIEERKYSNRTEYRIKIIRTYPKGINRKGTYEEYLSESKEEYYANGSRLWMEDYLFTAYRNPSFFSKLMQGDYNEQKKSAILECKKIIKLITREEKPTIKNHEVKT